MKRSILICVCMVLLAVTQVWSADIVLKVGDSPGDSGYRDGDIIEVFTAADITRLWEAIDARGEAGLWVGADRSRAPLSETELRSFVVLNVAEAVAVANRSAWTAPVMSGSQLTRKRARRIPWWDRLTDQQRADVLDGVTPVELRAIEVDATHVREKPDRMRIFCTGDSTTLQSASYLEAAMPAHDVHSNARNGRDSWFNATNIYTWMDDPDDNGVTPPPGQYDIVRWNCGITDSQPHGRYDNITSQADFRSNFRQIVSEIRRHSPEARIIYSTAARIEANRLTLDPPPASGFVDIASYNAALAGYAVVAREEAAALNVAIDPKRQWLNEHTPAGEGLPAPAHANTGAYWHYDGIHFDPNYLEHEGQRTAIAIRRAL